MFPSPNRRQQPGFHGRENPGNTSEETKDFLVIRMRMRMAFVYTMIDNISKTKQ